MKHISPLYNKFSFKGGGWDEQRQPKMQPSAEIVRVECAKCRRECDLSGPRKTLRGDRARRVREMQARVRFVRCARNPLRRSCVSSARNADESAICPVRSQPSAEIVSVEYGSRTYHDNQPNLIHERWPNQSIEDRNRVAHGEAWQFWRVVRWSNGWEDWVRNNSRNFTDAYTVQICFGSTR